MTSVLKVAVLVAVTAFTANAAQAQWYSSARPNTPIYPEALQQQASAGAYAVEVAPGQYVIHRPGDDLISRAPRRVERPAPVVRAPRVRNTGRAINTTKYVRHKPTVVERRRYVDDPPRVIEQYTVVDDATGQKKVLVEAPQGVVPPPARAGRVEKSDGKAINGKKRVIQADAEITVLGPDRMTIQLYRKGERGKIQR